ncbi:MAG TPA: sarcosine oxidase subunit gamma family protein [Actinospica sp.]|nr:sarcosine oxidase subunit gamma family protein [Actinospica sp.]
MTVETRGRRSPLAAYATDFSALPDGLRIKELPFLGQFSLRLDPAGPAAAAVKQLLGCALPEPCTETRGADAEVLWLGPDEFLILTSDASTDLPFQLREAIGDGFASVIDVSAQRTTLRLDGPLVREVLARGCAIDLDPSVSPAGTCVQTLLAQAGVVLRVLGPASIGLLVRPSFAPYLADWLIDACAEYRAQMT